MVSLEKNKIDIELLDIYGKLLYDIEQKINKDKKQIRKFKIMMVLLALCTLGPLAYLFPITIINALNNTTPTTVLIILFSFIALESFAGILPMALMGKGFKNLNTSLNEDISKQERLEEIKKELTLKVEYEKSLVNEKTSEKIEDKHVEKTNNIEVNEYGVKRKIKKKQKIKETLR